MEFSIEVKSLTKKFGSFTAVDNISFSVGKGEIFGFLGPNGAGKTTTIRLLCGLMDPTGGEGKVAGLDIKKQSEEIKTVVGYMSQKFSLYEDLTSMENMEFFSGIYGLTGEKMRARIKEVIELTDLGGKERALAASLAGGYRQRLALACAILHDPKVIFLDEPTAGVDPISRRVFWELIHQFSDRGITTLVTTHYMDEAEYCNRLALIYEGKIIDSGSPSQLKGEKLMADLLEVECEPLLEGMNLLRNPPYSLEVGLSGASLHVIMEHGRISEESIMKALADNKITVVRSEKKRASLEDFFVTLIDRMEREKIKK